MWSRGSSVTIARDQLRTALERGRDTHPERARLVFYFGDGEQTAQDPRPFDIASQLINGGAVLGYGTAAGGRMAITAAFETGDIVDPSTGQPAISVIDEEQLAAISNQLGVPYLHRQRRGPRDRRGVRLKELAPLRATDSGEIVGGRAELGWVALCLAVRRRLGDQVSRRRRVEVPAPRPTSPGRVVERLTTGRYAAGRLAAQPNSSATRGGTTIARPLDTTLVRDPLAPREVEPTGTGGQR